MTRYLLEEKANVVVYDPKVVPSDITELFPTVTVTNDPLSSAEGCHAIVICTDWPQFKTLDYNAIYDKMQHPAFLFDGRNIVSLQEMEKIGYVARILGK